MGQSLGLLHAHQHHQLHLSRRQRGLPGSRRPGCRNDLVRQPSGGLRHQRLDCCHGPASSISGQELRYKIGVAQTNVASVFPSTSENIRVKQRMETVFSITNFNAATARYRPHNDYGKEQTNGLTDGFHVLRARAFLQRPGRAAIYNTFVQPFYYDTQRPLGEILYPTERETLGSASYEAVVRTDSQTTEVWYRIADGDARNDDSTTGKNNGNGAWVKASRAAMTTALAQNHGEGMAIQLRQYPSTGSATLQVRLRELSSLHRYGPD